MVKTAWNEPQRTVRRFYSAVQATATCWLWTAGKTGIGYGNFMVGKHYPYKPGRTISAHVFAWELLYGPIRTSDEVCHTCNVKHCVSPLHLYLGTHAQNMADVAASDVLKGERHHLAKCTDEQARLILQEFKAGSTNVEIAQKYGLKYCTVNGLTSRRAYRHLTAE